MVLNFLKVVTKIRILSFRSLHQIKFKMDKAYLRQIDDDKFELAFRFLDEDLRIDRQFNFNRTFSETIDTFLARIITNFEKLAFRKKKKKKMEESSEAPYKVTASFLLDDHEIHKSKTCSEVFLTNKKVKLKLENKIFEVVVNPPWIYEFALPSYILATFPLYPSRFVAKFLDKSLSEFSWSRSKDKGHWIDVGKGITYLTSNEDIGYYMRLTCLPRNANGEGPCIDVISTCRVEASPGECPFETRHKFTAEKTTGNE